MEFSEKEVKELKKIVEMWFSEGFVSSFNEEQVEIARKLNIDLKNINHYIVP